MFALQDYLSLCTHSKEFIQWLTGKETYKSLGSGEPVHLCEDLEGAGTPVMRSLHSVVPVLDVTHTVFLGERLNSHTICFTHLLHTLQWTDESVHIPKRDTL